MRSISIYDSPRPGRPERKPRWAWTVSVIVSMTVSVQRTVVLILVLFAAGSLRLGASDQAVSSQGAADSAQPSGLPAFPGAEGFGAYATGGRGGQVYHVTNLHDAGPGSFRDAVSQGHRIVVFDVGGYIPLLSILSVHSDLTIAGQTAPGDGIGVLGQEVSFSHASNIIVRYIRFRQSLHGAQHKSSVALFSGSNMIFDHVSIEWGRWDCLDMNESANITFQNCIIGEGIAPQRFGCLCGSNNITFLRNLWINNQSRNPKAKGKVQFVNNIVYNWGVTGFVGGHSAADHYADLLNNYFIKGPSSSDKFAGEFTSTDHVYQAGNYAGLARDGRLNGRLITSADLGTATVESRPFTALLPRIDTAEAAYRKVVASAGDSLPRDSVDARLIRDLTSLGRQGQIIQDPATVGGPGILKGGTAPVDSDGDGIPDAWERQHGLNPTDPSDANGDFDHTGYTNVEKYINGLADGSYPRDRKTGHGGPRR